MTINRKTPPALEKHWLHNGPHINDAKANAMHHLRRYNFKLEGGEIFAPPGFELSKEDAMAVEYLVLEYGFEYHRKAK